MASLSAYFRALLLVLFSAHFAGAAVVTNIPIRAAWRFADFGANQGTAWREINFNDAAWRSGIGQFGYGDGDEATIVSYGPNSSAKYITTYFRKTFVITNAPQYTNLVARVLRDDGAVVYLNGAEVARQNMPAGTITYTTPASTSIPSADEVTFFPTNINPRLLINGTNLIAIEVHQNGGQTSDMSFDFELFGAFTTNAVPPTVTLTTPAQGTYFYRTSSIILSANATAAAGAITQVVFFAGSSVIGEVSTAPFQITWVDPLPGTHSLTARATDSSGLTGDSSPVTVHILAEHAPWPFIITAGSAWKYRDTGANLGTAWQAPDFDDIDWPTGNAQLGYGDGDEATVISNGSSTANRHITSYFRKSFVAAGGYTNLYLRLLRDDGAVVYLNGVEIFRSNMGGGPMDNTILALAAIGGADENTFYLRRVNPNLLVSGTNVVAVEIHQSDPDSSDVSFDFELSGNIPDPDTSLYLSAGQRGTIRCVDHPDMNYDLYLPPSYAATGASLPLLYTFHANGGGMNSQFQAVAANLQFILVGITDSQNGLDWQDYIDVLHAVTRDVRQRINYDPTAVFAGGWSGGAVAAYDFSKFLRQEIAGVFGLSGWLQHRTNSVDRYLTNLHVARANGNSDTAANFYLTPDSNHLARFNVVIRDWSFSGGHVIAPDSVKTECLNWLLTQRIPPGPNDATEAAQTAAAWNSLLQNGEDEQVFRECIATLLTRPRSHHARAAMLMLDECSHRFDAFRHVDVTTSAAGDYALDLFYFRGFGAAKAGNENLYFSALKAATGVTETSGDRSQDFRNLQQTFGFPVPRLSGIQSSANNTVTISFSKDAPGVAYRLETTAGLNPGTWSVVNASETAASGGSWSVTLSATDDRQFLRLGATIP